MSNKIFKNILLVALFVLLATTSFVVDEMYNSFNNSQEEILKAETRIIAYGINKDGISFLDGLNDSDYRVTLISKDGSVLFDNSNSDISFMDNHLDRKEVIEALETGYGRSTRQSSTLTERLIYTAIKLDNGDVIRLSTTSFSIFHIIEIIAQPLLLVVLMIIIVSLFIAYNVAQKIVEPLNRIDLDDPKKDNCYKEIEPILNRIIDQQNVINKDREMLQRKRNEFEAITENMNEGMILMNTEKIIVDFNKAASNILNIDHDSIGKSIETIDNYSSFSDLFENQYENKGLKKLKVADRLYELELYSINGDKEKVGQVLLIFDETYKKANEMIRKEFASNVSHELKTPLQAISGYAELLKNGVVRNEDQKECLDKIYSEAQRMITLIGDIIKLSHLDDDELKISREIIDLDQKTRSFLDTIKNEYSDKTKTVYEGEKALIYANSELLESIIYNLYDNAYKYNREDGTIKVIVKNNDDHVLLIVEDEGIGIPEEDYERIFERFYRVDKSRSRKVGGTGLGLSIVKHACILNDASIRVESKINEGSRFIVSFPKA